MEEVTGRQHEAAETGGDRARQRTELEMLDGTEVVNVVGASGAEPVAEGRRDVDRSRCRISCRGR